jgi:hypothetical protein
MTLVQDSRTKVLYIGGAGRSGSTLMERIIASTGDCVAVGELRWIWDRGVRDNQRCSCGEAFHSCPFWRAVVEHAFGGIDSARVREMEALRLAVDRIRNIPAMAMPRVRARDLNRKLEVYGDFLASLYASIGAVSGASFIVDSSKDAPYAYLLNTSGRIDLRLLHLVRDSRAVAFSWQRSKVRPEIAGRTEYMKKFAPGLAAFLWLGMNSAIGALALTLQHAAFVRYEDLVRAPDMVTRLLAELSLPAPQPIPSTPHPPSAGSWHSVSGNPVRFARGTVDVVPDEQWRIALDRKSFCVVTAVTLPLLVKYGYPLTSAV